MVERVDGDNRGREGTAQLIRRCLEQCAAANVDLLCGRLNLDRRAISDALNDLVTRGEVEELRPVAARDRVESRDCARRILPAHYRLKRQSDLDYLWEQEVPLTRPVGCASHMRELESLRQYRGPEPLSAPGTPEFAFSV